MNREGKFGQFPSAADHIEEPGPSHRPTAFGVEDKAALQVLPPQLAQCPDLLAGKWVRAIDAILRPPHMDAAAIKLDHVPGQFAEFAGAKTVSVGDQDCGRVAMGLVASLNRPGGNLTGVANLMVELGQKQLELLHQLVPAVAIMAVLINPILPAAESQARDLQAAARKLGIDLHVLHASTERDLDTAFAKMADMRVGALAITADAFFLSRREQIIALAARHSLPATSPWREAAAAGGLMSYGTSDADGYRQLGSYAGRILKGEKPANLPVQQSTKFELIINLKTAKALGIDVPMQIQQLADEVIE